MENQKNEERKVLELTSCISSVDRDNFALAAMQVFLNHQGTPTATPINRIRMWLGFRKWKQNFDYNFEQIAQRSYEMADYMLKAKK